MRELLFYSLETNLYLIAIIILHQFGFRKAANYSFSRGFLLVGILCSLLLPLIKLEVFLTSYNHTVLTTLNNQIAININEVSHQNQGSIPIFYTIYALISTLLFIKLLVGLFKILQLKKRSIKKVNYYQISNNTTAFSFFNWVFIGDQIPEKEQKHILKHELVHSDQLHSIDILVCHLLEIAFWWNPILYLLKRQFMELHEYEADEKSCSDPTSYIELLLKLKFNNYNTNIIHQFNSKYLKTRIMRIKQNPSKKINLKTLISAFIILGLLFTFSNTLNSQENTLQSNSTSHLNELTSLSELSHLTKLVHLDEFKTLSNNMTAGEVEKKAQFPGGQDALIKFMCDNIKYPKETEQEGTVFIEFIVDKNGKCKDFKVLKGVNDIIDASAMEAIKKMPKWEPAQKDGKKVATSYTIPIKYTLPEGKG